MAPVRAIGIFGAQAPIGGIFVDHRVHAPWRDAEEEARTPQLLEVAPVAMPVGLWHDGHTEACRLEGAANDGSTKGGMVHVGIAGEEDDIHVVPSSQLQLLLRRGQKIRQPIFHQLNGVPWKARVVMPRLLLPRFFQLMNSSTSCCRP